MANHKKVKPPQARSHCSMCKPWKDGRITHESEGFESHSAHVRRTGLVADIVEDSVGPAAGCGEHPVASEGHCPLNCAGCEGDG